MAYLIAAMWSVGIVINFISPGSLVFSERARCSKVLSKRHARTPGGVRGRASRFWCLAGVL